METALTHWINGESVGAADGMRPEAPDRQLRLPRRG